MPFYGTSEWRGADGRVSRKTFRLQVTGATPEDQFAAAVTGHDNIVGALDQITAATLQDKSVSYVIEDYNIGLGDISEAALLNVWAEDPLNAIDVLALSQVYVPAPVIGIFQATSGPDMNRVDTNDADLQAFIAALAEYGYVSDLEVIDTGAGNGGMENGRRVTRKTPKT